MQSFAPQQSNDVLRASHAIGAIFVTIFGGMWLVGWSLLALPGSAGALAAIAVCALALLSIAGSQFRRYRSALAVNKGSPQQRKIILWFNIVNATQWVLVIGGVSVLNMIGQTAWIVPFIMLIVGLHFLPLAHIFTAPHNYVVGTLLTAFALAYPFITPGGPQDPIGCLGAGLTLWGAAIYVLTKRVPAQGN
jgi:hypothetical protein